jgi:hypothetical protein
MSTRLLTTPGKIHELCDDLESVWFVLLYLDLHFVKHNMPSGINMASIFDHVDVSLTSGTHRGGLGKRDLYASGAALMTRRLRFSSKPMTSLVRHMYRLFRSLHAHYVKEDDEAHPSKDDSEEDASNEDNSDEDFEEHNPKESVNRNVEKLRSCEEMKKLLRRALGSERWPKSCDKVEDQYPPNIRPTSKQKETIAFSYVNCSLEPGEPSGTKRKREVLEEENLPAPETKRPKLWERIRAFIWG